MSVHSDAYVAPSASLAGEISSEQRLPIGWVAGGDLSTDAPRNRGR